jgi:hypothetical protein
MYISSGSSSLRKSGKGGETRAAAIKGAVGQIVEKSGKPTETEQKGQKDVNKAVENVENLTLKALDIFDDYVNLAV